MGQVTVLEAPESYNLVDLQTVKDLLGVTSTAKDTIYTSLIPAVSSFVSRRCNQRFIRERLQEDTVGYGDTQMLLTGSPIESVDSVLLNGEPVLGYKILDRDAGVLYLSKGWTWTASVSGFTTPQPVVGSEDPLFTIDYYAGYWPSYFAGPKPAGAIDMPIALQKLVADLIAFMETRGGADPNNGIAGYKIGDYSQTFNTITSGDAANQLPVHLSMQLDQWVRVV